MITLSQQFFFNRQVVFYNAVMNYSKQAFFIAMRMSIHIGRTAVGCPTSVTDTNVTRIRVSLYHSFQISQTAYFFLNFNRIVCTENGNTCGIVTTVFKLRQAFHHKRRCIFKSDITDNTTHVLFPP